MKTKKYLLSAVALCAGLTPIIADTVEERLSKQEKEITEIRKQLNASKGSSTGLGFPSWFSLNGEWEWEYVDAEVDVNDSSADPTQHFQHDKFVLKPKITLSENLYMKGEIEFGSSHSKLEEYHAHFTGLPMNSWIKLGLDERFSKADKSFDMADRKTENYPLIGSAFWRDEQHALTWGGKTKASDDLSVFWRLQVSKGLELNDKDIGEVNNPTSQEMTHDDDNARDTGRSKTTYGYGLGFSFAPTESYKFDVAAWYFDSELNDDEKSYVTGITNYSLKDSNPDIQNVSDTQTRFGVRTTHKFNGTTLTYEYAEAEDGKFKRDGYYIQGSHAFKFNPLIGGEFVKSIEPLVRIEEYDTNLQASFADGDTWDRDRQVYALLVGIVSNDKLKATLKLEYVMNEERTGAVSGVTTQSNDPDNDEFLAQFEFKF